MAELVFTNASFIITTSSGDVDLSARTKSVTANFTQDLLDISAMSDTYRNRIVGLKDSTVTAQLHEDFALQMTNETLWDVWSRGTQVTLTLRPIASTPRGTTNPEYTIPALLGNMAPMDAQHGAVGMQNVTFQGNGTVNRITTST